MAIILLHLVDDEGQPVSSDIRLAVDGAYRYVSQRFTRIDQALLAGMAEDVAAAMCRRLDRIQSLNQYALAAMVGKVHEWLRAHRLVEVGGATDKSLEKTAGGVRDRSFGLVENDVLFEQMKIHLTEREKQILVLIEQDLGNPTAIASALGLSYDAAKKALYRAREKMSSLLKGCEDRRFAGSQDPYTSIEAVGPKMKK